MSDKRWMVKGDANGEWIYDPDGNPISEVHTSRQFDAALKLVHAANSHDGLVQSLLDLRFLVRHINRERVGQTEVQAFLKTANSTIEEALRQAKGAE